MTTEVIIAWKNFPNILEKARSKANRRYPSILEIDDDAEFGEYDINEAKRDIFIEGYAQAAKDFGWHSVKESLPPVGEEVIALCNESHGTTLPIACYMCFAHLVEDKTIFVEYDGWNIPGVKYWMPCPELPEK